MSLPCIRVTQAPTLRTALAFVAAIVAPAVLTISLFVFLMILPGAGRLDATWLAMIGVATIAVSAAHVVVLFAPAYVVLRRRGRMSLANITAAGFACAALPSMLLLIVLGEPGPRMMLPLAAGMGLGSYGAIGGVAFWWIWRANATAPAWRST